MSENIQSSEKSEKTESVQDLNKIEVNTDHDAEQTKTMETDNITSTENNNLSNTIESDFVNNQQKLDSHLAMIEEQYRKSFDERLSSTSTNNRQDQNEIFAYKEDPVETIRTNKVFREVSRCVGSHWKPIYLELMSSFSAEILEREINKLEKFDPIIRGYKSLSAWKEVCGRSFNIMRLEDVLRNQEMDDIADSMLHIIDSEDLPENNRTKIPAPVQRRKTNASDKSSAIDQKSKTKTPYVLDNRRLLLLAKKIGSGCDYETLARALAIPEEEINEIKEAEDKESRNNDSKTLHQGTFKVLWAWKEMRSERSTVGTGSDVSELREVLEKVGMSELANEIDKIK